MSPKDKKMLMIKELEEKKILLRDYLVAGHRKPKTRREFLASGLLSVTSSLVAPTIAQLVSSSAWAQSGEVSCPSGGGDFPLFVHLQLAGGPALYANHLVSGPSGGEFGNYNNLGMGPQPERETKFASNAPIWIPGLRSKGSPMFNQVFSVLANDMDVVNTSAFVSIAAASIDDTTNDRQDMTGLLTQAGAIGSPLPYLMTFGNIGQTISVDTAAGARFKGAIYEEANFLNVSNISAIENGLGFGVAGALGQFPGNTAQKLSVHQTMTKLIEDLNKYQVEQIAREPNSHASQKIFKSLVTCASEKNSANQALANNIVDIYNANYPGGTDLAGVFARNRSGEMNRVIGNVGQSIGACLSGLTNGAVITLGGYDYHNGRTRSQADAKDNFAGDIIGRILLAAKKRNKKIFLFISADGSVSSPRGTSAGENVNWAGDLAQRGMAYMIAYDPAKTVNTAGFSLGSYSDAAFQLNHFVDDGGDFRVNNVNPIASLDANELFTSAVFLNYLNFAGKQSLIDDPKLALVKDTLVKSLPGGTLFDYYTRIKG